MAGRRPEEDVSAPVLRQRWDALTFIHWRYDVAAVRRVIPGRLQVEEIDGSAWVGLTPFVARRTRLGWPVAAPVVPDFPETNLRTYVRTPAGQSALWFLSLEAASAPVVGAARTLLGIPYRRADMRATTGPDCCEYRSRRRTGSRPGHHIVVRPGPPLGPGETRPRDHRLTGRWRAVVPRGGGLFTVPVRHEPWPLHSAELLHLEEDLLAAAGLPAPAGDPEVRWSPGVDAALGLPRPG